MPVDIDENGSTSEGALSPTAYPHIPVHDAIFSCINVALEDLFFK